MKKLFTLLLALVATTALWAEDFEVDGIYYKILTDKTNEVEVTYRGSSYNEYVEEYAGSVTIPSSVTYNGTTYSVTSIGDDAFAWCSGLTSITIPNSVTSIEGAFAWCSGLTSVTIGNSVTSIGYGAFYYCSSLTSITIPNSVTSIGSRVFSNCSSLTSVTIGNSVTSIGEGAFEYCSGLTSIVVEEGNTIYDSRENCNAIIETNSNTLILGCQNTIIPNSVKSIGEQAFYKCSGLTSVTIPYSVTTIGRYAFAGCSGLTSIVVEKGNAKYDSRDNCNAIIETATNTLISGCQNTIMPNSVTTIGNYAFYYCTGLTSITIPNSVTSIGYRAFCDCSSLTSIAIPNSVTSIGDRAFEYCSSLTSVTIGNSVTSIGDYAFYLCDGLTSVTIPNSVKSIGKKAFEYCTGLTSVTIPNSVTSIGEDAFAGCSGLTSVVWNAENHADFSSYFSSPFYDICSQITSFTFGDSVEHIPAYLCYLMDNLTSITIPNSVTSIGDAAFAYCYSLTSITIPNSVTSIGEWAFYYCYSLTSIKSLAEVPPTLGTDAFYNVPNNIPVYVPCGSVSAYQSAEGWEGFTNIQCMPEDESAVDNVHSQSANCQKILRDGQLLIIRDGKTYNAQGVEL